MNLIDDAVRRTIQLLRHPVQRLDIQLFVALDRHKGYSGKGVVYLDQKRPLRT